MTGNVEPAVAHVACPGCGEVIDVVIPVRASFSRECDGAQVLEATISAEDWSAQEVWDHALRAHGPIA